MPGTWACVSRAGAADCELLRKPHVSRLLLLRLLLLLLLLAHLQLEAYALAHLLPRSRKHVGLVAKETFPTPPVAQSSGRGKELGPLAAYLCDPGCIGIVHMQGIYELVINVWMCDNMWYV